jgi:TIR domain
MCGGGRRDRRLHHPRREDRRVFISYAHADGGPIAERLFDLLTRLRFDVFLDRFRRNPGVDFIERIADELADKAMIAVVETPHAVRSSRDATRSPPPSNAAWGWLQSTSTPTDQPSTRSTSSLAAASMTTV